MKLYFVIGLMLIANFSFGQSAEFTAIESRIKELISKHQWDELLITAPELITEEPSRGEGYYYTAVAFYQLDELDKATEYLNRAEKLADEKLKEKLEKLKKDIAGGAIKQQLTDKANQSDGNTMSAADFKKLWELDKSKIEYAISSVELYIDKEDYPAALLILNDPVIIKDQEARKLAEKLNQTPKMQRLNGYNDAMKEGDLLFKKGSFQAAINKFDAALGFFQKDDKASSYKRKAQDELAWETASNTHSIESYKKYLEKYPYGIHSSEADDILQRSYLKYAREGVKANNFDEGVRYYQIYQSSYPRGPHIKTVNSELCELYFSEAKKVEKGKNTYNMSRAIELYGLAKKCGIERASESHLKSLKRKEKRWGRDDIGFFGWHADQKNMLGFMSGSLNNRKIGMYVAARTGNDFFKTPATWETDDDNSLTESADKNKRYNNISYNQRIYATIGITKKIVHPLWIYGGAGACFNTQLKEFVHLADGEIEYVKNKDEKYVAINPEIGLQVKLGFLTVRYGVNKPMNPKFTEQFVQHFGVGIKF